MEIFIFTFLFMVIALLGMAVGVFFGRRPISGGCGNDDRTRGAGIGCGVCGVENRRGR